MKQRSVGDLYEVVVGLFLAGGLLYALASVGVPDLLDTAAAAGYAPEWIAAALLSFATGAWVGGWQYFGPQASQPAELRWRLSSGDPTNQLRRRAIGNLVASGLLGAVVAAMASPSLEMVGAQALTVSAGIWVALQVVTALAMYAQRRDIHWLGQGAAWVFCTAGIVALAGVTWGAAVGVAVAMAFVALSVAVRPSSSVSWPLTAALTPQWQLVRGGQNRSSVMAGVTMFDVEGFRIARQHQATATQRPLPAFVYTARRHVRAALIVAWRNTRAAVVIGAMAVPLVLALDELLGRLAAISVLVIAEYSLVVTVARSAELWVSSNSLHRIWATGKRPMGLALATPGVIACVVLVLVVAVGVPMPVTMIVILAAMPAAVVLRRRSVHRPADDITLLSTPMGALSLQAVNRVVAGPDVALVTLFIVTGL